MKTISKLVSTAAMAVVSFSAGYAQSNLGASCGCPPVASRPTVLLSSVPGAVSLIAGKETELTANTILTCDKTYILDQKIAVASGKNITIRPGTVIKGRTKSTADSATALIIERGAQIIADGTAECPIVFTAEADPMDGSYCISNIGKWGGLVIAGKATNNLTLAANGPFATGKLAASDGLGVFEGFATNAPRFRFGVDLTGTVETAGTFDDNDNSGILRYVSVRHAGAVLTVGGEINGITLGSVGRGTTIDHVEIVSSADDAIEFFGGTVNIKYVSVLYGNDDMFDWDLGWSGKAQFLFGLKANTTSSVDSDNGFEADADDNKSNLLPRSHPFIYNATFIGNSKAAFSSDNSGPAAIRAKELTEGEIYNSVFANFRYGFNVNKAMGTRPGTSEAYHNWANTGGNGTNSLKIKANTFINMFQKAIAIENNGTGVVSASDSTQFFTTDMNVHAASVAGFSYAYTYTDCPLVVTASVDATPNPALATTIATPVDGFFAPANYRGAFASTGKNWLSDWSYAALIGGGSIGGAQPCPTDINQDGITNNSDFLLLLGQFGQSCH